MTMTTTWQLIATELRHLVPAAGAILGIVVLILIATWITKALTDHRWRAEIRHHLPEIAREQLRRRDERIRELELQSARLQEENEQLFVAVRGARACLDLPRQEVRNQMRVARR